jgi:hypothetical protein
VAALESHASVALIDPALYAAGWTEELIRREVEAAIARLRALLAAEPVP